MTHSKATRSNKRFGRALSATAESVSGRSGFMARLVALSRRRARRTWKEGTNPPRLGFSAAGRGGFGGHANACHVLWLDVFASDRIADEWPGARIRLLFEGWRGACGKHGSAG